MKNLFLSVTILCCILIKEKTCSSRPKIQNDDSIYFRPDESIQKQAKPTLAEESIHESSIQMVNNYPVQYSNQFQSNDYVAFDPQVAINRGNIRRPSIVYQQQYSSTPVPFNGFDTQYYSSTNSPFTTSREERFTQSTLFKGQGFNASAAIGKFGLDMMQNAYQRTNLVVSPYSVTTLLALLQQGATGETQQQISRALQMPVDVSAISYKQLTDSLRERYSGHNILKVANNLFISNDFNLNQDFKNKAIYNFGSGVTPLNFFNPSKAAGTINKWVSNSTNNKINQLVSSDSISRNTQLVLVNALLFKGVWQIKFRPEATLSREFNINGKESKPTLFMRARRYYRYGEDKLSHLQVIVLPFENEEYSLMVLLPSRQSSVGEILRSLTYEKLAEYQNFTPQDVDLELPKFTARSDIDLYPLLREMGITNIFSGASELYGIGNAGKNAPQVSSAVHSAIFSIDEEGGTAAAATAFTVVALSYNSPDAVFRADRPFLAILWDTKLALPLIMAKINDPTS